MKTGCWYCHGTGCEDDGDRFCHACGGSGKLIDDDERPTGGGDKKPEPLPLPD